MTTLSTNSLCDDNTISNILAALVGSNTCRVKKLSSTTRHRNVWSSTPVLCSVSRYFPWLKSPILIQSHLLISLITFVFLIYYAPSV